MLKEKEIYENWFFNKYSKNCLKIYSSLFYWKVLSKDESQQFNLNIYNEERIKNFSARINFTISSFDNFKSVVPNCSILMSKNNLSLLNLAKKWHFNVTTYSKKFFQEVKVSYSKI